jgi:hypothetical protein
LTREDHPESGRPAGPGSTRRGPPWKPFRGLLLPSHPLNLVLRGLFGPLLKLLGRWPPLLAYGVVFGLLILIPVLLHAAVPQNLFWLLSAVFVLVLISFLWTEWISRRPPPGPAPETGPSGPPRTTP